MVGIADPLRDETLHLVASHVGGALRGRLRFLGKGLGARYEVIEQQRAEAAS